jgi:hypothetical protein
MNAFAPNPGLTISTTRLGTSGEPVLIIEDFLSDPDALLKAAATSDGWRAQPPGGYPGRRAPLPGAYARGALRRMDGPIRARLFATPMRLDRFECSFSMVTQPPQDLATLQRVPHIDIARGSRVAILHYLCGPDFGGTAFFRQDATGLEQIGPDRRARYTAARAQDVDRLRETDSYPHAQTPGYTRTGYTEARFNRLVAYRSFTLHSGIVDPDAPLPDDPRRGRLTATFFVDYAAAD